MREKRQVEASMAVRERDRLYSAARIGRPLGLKRQMTLRRLRGVEPDGLVLANGQTARAWRLESLPPDLFNELEEKARVRGYRSTHRLLNAPSPAWTPDRSLNEIGDRYIEKAVRLRDAFSMTLNRLHDRPSAKADLERLGLDEFRKIFGYGVSARHWNRLFKMILERDGGAHNWERLEIYLQDRAAKAKRSGGGAPRRKSDIPLDEVESALALIKSPTNPQRGETALVWSCVFEAFESGLEGGLKRLNAKKALLDFLGQKCCWISGSRDSLNRAFNRKYKRWVAGGRNILAVADGRGCSGNYRTPELTEEDKRKLLARACERGGGLAQAWRELLGEGKLSGEIRNHYMRGSANKFNLPSRIRKELGADLKNIQDWRRGPRTAKLNGAYVSRDPSAICAGDWYQADDATLPVYYYDEGEDGVTGNPLRGQFLVMIDFRSWMIMGFVLVSERWYSAFHIRNLVTEACDNFGFPREGFYFENGPWKTSKLLVGRKDEIPWDETEMGLRRHGLRFRHASLPRGKVVERVLGFLQDLMEGVPGYVGRAEMTDKFERTQKVLQLIRQGKIRPSERLLSKSEWIAKLNRACNLYNNQPLEGKYHEGLSPRQVYEKTFSTPLVKLDGRTRYLIANNKITVRCGRNGISFRFGKNTFTYKNEFTGMFRGRKVIAWFNPEYPEVLSFTDEREETVYTVEREIAVPAMDAPDEVLGAAMAQNAAHESPRRDLYQSLRPHFSETFEGRRFMPNLVDVETENLGLAMTRDREAMKSQLNERKALIRKAQRLSVKTGIRFRLDSPRLKEQLKGAEDLARMKITPGSGF